MTFEFDPEKSAANLAKHGIDFVEAQALWEDELRTVSPAQLGMEDRKLVTGMIGGKLWTAVVTYRNGVTRIISVRRARVMEARRYGAQNDQR